MCGFIYNASEATNGSIHSPNYPGYYPRATDCHYEFHGHPDHHIRIRSQPLQPFPPPLRQKAFLTDFTYFDVEGYAK